MSQRPPGRVLYLLDPVYTAYVCSLVLCVLFYCKNSELDIGHSRLGLLTYLLTYLLYAGCDDVCLFRDIARLWLILFRQLIPNCTVRMFPKIAYTQKSKSQVIGQQSIG